MKRKLLYIVLVLCLLLSASSEEVFAETWILLDAANSTEPGTLKAVTFADFRTWSCDVTTTGNPTAVAVCIEGNQTGAMVFDPSCMADVTLTAAQIAANIGSFSIVDSPARYIRARLKILTGGTLPTVSVVCTGVR
ncbi:hypothetical protein [Candidatus Magnetobacterium casense]|uniref:Secreted protein n=1 Tax=Candidatus Magnetobacterium casense TaxID=1455061 RepID=A0ABS6S2Q2_9BACT|nr:hypothetical protein [Candidatus Magnetobacterium casensis]MBV6342684.1 hypothetical protein [Candidatus Magnetobacterium casensis]